MKNSFYLLCLLLLMPITEAIPQAEYSSELLDQIGLPYDPQTKRITYTDNVRLSNLSRDHIFDIIKKTLIAKYGSLNYPVIIDSREDGKYEIKSLLVDLHYFSWHFIICKNTYYDILFTLDIEAYDRSFKYTMTDFYVHPIVGEPYESEIRSIDWENENATTPEEQNSGSAAIPLEEFFSSKESRRDEGLIYVDFQYKQKEFVDDLVQVLLSKSEPKNSEN